MLFSTINRGFIFSLVNNILPNYETKSETVFIGIFSIKKATPEVYSI